MKKFLHSNKNLIIGFSLVASFLFLGFVIMAQPTMAFVQDGEEDSSINSAPVIFTPQVSIPGSNFQKGVDMNLEASTGPIARYISAIYNYGVGIVGIVAAMMLMIGGIIWLTSAGSSSKIEQAKSFIGSSLTGMVLVLTAYILLKTINPALVELKTSSITVLEELKCCQVNSGAATAAAMTYPSACKEKGGTVFNSDYLASRDGKTCQKSGCCIDSSIPAGLVGSLSQAFSGDSLSGTSLKYRASFKEDCKTGLDFPTTALLTAGLFGSQNSTAYMDTPCSDIKRDACKGRGEQEVCPAPTRYGFCYGGKCIGGTGQENDPCGDNLGLCFKGDECPGIYVHEQFGGINCGNNLRCCAPKDSVENEIKDYCASLAAADKSYLCPYTGICNDRCQAIMDSTKAQCEMLNCMFANSNKPAGCPRLKLPSGTTVDTGVATWDILGEPFGKQYVKSMCQNMNWPELTINRAGKYCQWDSAKDKCVNDPN